MIQFIWDSCCGPTCAAPPGGPLSAQLCTGPPPAGRRPQRLCAGPQRAAPPPGPPGSPRTSADTAALSRPAAASLCPASFPPPAGPSAAAESPPSPAGETCEHTSHLHTITMIIIFYVVLVVKGFFCSWVFSFWCSLTFFLLCLLTPKFPSWVFRSTDKKYFLQYIFTWTNPFILLIPVSCCGQLPSPCTHTKCTFITH